MLNKIFHIFLTLQIGFISIIGDRIIEQTNDITLRAIVDNLTHALVAAISWTLIVVLDQDVIIHNIPNIILCTVISSWIDVDHFIEARSWKLNDATQLPQRPFLHWTTIPILLWLLLFQLSKLYESQKLENYGWILLISFLSHHVRDATRRGLTFTPFGTTRAIPYYLYIFIDMILPHVIFLLRNRSMNKLTTYRGITSTV